MKKEFLCIILFLVINTSLTNASNKIHLKSRRFTPAKGVSDSAKAKIEAIPQRAHVIIQLEKIPTIEEKKELEAKGIKLLSYISNKAWFASIPSDKVSEIASLSDVRSICEIAPEDKISSTIREKGVGDYSTNKDGTVNLAIKFFKDISLNRSVYVVSKNEIKSIQN